MLFLIYLLVGAVAGVLAGLFGVGGGTIIVPALLLCFTWQGIPLDLQTHLAIGTSLACIVITSVSSARTHHSQGAVRWSLVWWLTPGIAVGVWAGAGLAAQLHGLQLQRLFGLFAWIIAIQMWTGWQPGSHYTVPGKAGLSLAGLVIGGASALFGIGGGSLTVPFLVGCRVRMQEAVATAAACGFPIALVGAAAYIYQGQSQTGLPAGSLGFVFLPAFLGMGIASTPCAWLGARLAHRWPAATLKRLFAGFLILIGSVLLAGIR
ncbi:MAG TPA: sulfite exporter TauE/SafE family protein [Pseudomonadales bacterium]|nr:sulfite exporter TauE/SafE family protein [Pseudomonadales bacterium]